MNMKTKRISYEKAQKLERLLEEMVNNELNCGYDVYETKFYKNVAEQILRIKTKK